MKKLIFNIVLLFIWVYSLAKWMLPYNRAKVSMAYKLYMDTTMYKERAAEFGKEFAFTSFIENGEHTFFLKKLTFLDKVKAAIVPFSYTGVKGNQ